VTTFERRSRVTWGAAVLLLLAVAGHFSKPARSISAAPEQRGPTVAEAPVKPWTPPIGIPAPSFGITETAPATPNPWTSPKPGFYYVEQKRGATDDDNQYGTPARPRWTIPDVLPAGSVVELHGAYDRPHSNPHGLVSMGTAASPVFIRGVSRSDRPLIRRSWEVTGSYLVLENLEFGPAADKSATGTMVVLSPASHLALRYSEFHGTLTDGGMAVENWNNGASGVDNVVIYASSFHDNGDVNASFDQDVEGIHVGSYVNHLWVVDNELYRNSGDGIQINATEPLKATTHHIYVGRNVSHHNKQGGFWVKQAVDVVFSENLAYAHRPGNSSMGHCLGAQYGPERVWWLYNHAHDCEFGIALMSDWQDGAVTHDFFIGNVIHNIHRTTLRTDPLNAWSSSGILLAGGSDRYVVDNTIVDVDSGINAPSPFGSLEVAGNIIANLGSRTIVTHINIGFPSLASHTKVYDNLLFPQPRFIWGESPVVLLTKEQMANSRNTEAEPLFVDAANDDFRLRSDSHATGRGEMHAVYGFYQKLYGLDIGTDRARGTSSAATGLGRR
jgi:Right handed beta helix region